MSVSLAAYLLFAAAVALAEFAAVSVYARLTIDMEGLSQAAVMSGFTYLGLACAFAIAFVATGFNLRPGRSAARTAVFALGLPVALCCGCQVGSIAGFVVLPGSQDEVLRQGASAAEPFLTLAAVAANLVTTVCLLGAAVLLVPHRARDYVAGPNPLPAGPPPPPPPPARGPSIVRTVSFLATTLIYVGFFLALFAFSAWSLVESYLTQLRVQLDHGQLGTALLPLYFVIPGALLFLALATIDKVIADRAARTWSPVA
jgi:hypothetical protein